MDETTEVISLICPTRHRPENVNNFVSSALLQAERPDALQFVFYVDEDDNTFPLIESSQITVVTGPRTALSLMSNACLPRVVGEILMYAGDDLEFISSGWDSIVRNCFRSVPDKILLVHGDDLGQNPKKLATHGFLHRTWVDTVGYFIPPYFPADWADTWLTQVADRIHRRWLVPELHIEHKHYAWGKGTIDQTHEERIARLKSENLGSRYRRLRPERRLDAKKLKAQMDSLELPVIKRMGVSNRLLPTPGTRVLHRPRWLQ